MDPTQLTALVAADLTRINAAWQAESDTRQVIAGQGHEQLIAQLFPGINPTLLRSNKDTPNYLQQGTARYVRALTRGALNWEWEGDDQEPDPKLLPGAFLNLRGRDLVQDATTDALVAGKFAYFAFIGPDGRFRVVTLAGFLWPVYAPGDASEVVAVLQINSSMLGDKKLYEVRRYLPGLLEVYGGLEDWQKYAAVLPQTFDQPHARNRLPLAFRIVGRDANREPEGLAQTALSPYRRYVKYAVLVGLLATRGGFEERVVKSDLLASLVRDNPRHPMAQDLKDVGPNKLRVMDAGGTYERLSPVALADYREQEAAARADVRDAMNMPDTGGDLSGEALAEKREAYTESVESFGGSIGDALTEVHELGAALRPAELRAGYRVTLEPRFTRDVEGERRVLLEEFKAGLPKSAWFSGLQSLGVSQITEAHVEQARAEEDALSVRPGEGG